jgi:hypothetical protein
VGSWQFEPLAVGDHFSAVEPSILREKLEFMGEVMKVPTGQFYSRTWVSREMAQAGRSSSGEAPIGHVEIAFSGSCAQLTGLGGHRAGSGGIGLEAIEMSSSDP